MSAMKSLTRLFLKPSTVVHNRLPLVSAVARSLAIEYFGTGTRAKMP